MCWKLKATNGRVARVAATETANASTSPLASTPHNPSLPRENCQARLQGSDRDVVSRAIPATAVKLNWKDTCLRTGGSRPAITAAASARAGRMLLGLPRARASR